MGGERGYKGEGMGHGVQETTRVVKDVLRVEINVQSHPSLCKRTDGWGKGCFRLL